MKQSALSRHPVEVEAIGLLQHAKQNAYMFSVLWSDHNKLLIYRTFVDFKRFQRDLKKRFPLEAGAVNKSDRTLPKLKDVSRTLAKKKETRRVLERLQKLETFSQSLLRLDAKISHCDIVVQFFTLKSHDLNPSFPDDSLVIMPSEKKEEKIIASPLTPAVSRPMISANHLCVADYETVDLRNRPFKVKRHELLDVLLKESSGWWLVENEDRQIAWFPAPYLQEERSHEADDHTKECQEKGILCVVTKGYEAQDSDEITVMVGVVVEVLRKSDNGWWLASYNKRTGYIPSLYLKPYTNPCEKIRNILSKKHNMSTPNLTGDVYSFMNHQPSLGDQRRNGSTLAERWRSQSLGSEARSDVDSDIDSMTGSSGRLNSSCSESSSLNTSNPSLAESSSSSVQPNVPPRPNREQIIQKCSTVTKKKLQSSLASLENSDTSGTRLLNLVVNGGGHTAKRKPSLVVPSFSCWGVEDQRRELCLLTGCLLMVQPTCSVYEFQLCTGERVTITAGDNMSRYPVEAKAVGLVQHGRQKLYMLSILWSDRNNIIIYRTYESFKEFSKLLSQTFPLEAGFVNKSDRTLPTLKDAPLFFRTKFSSRFMERLHLLEVYAQELLQTDPKVSQCENVIYFFSPNKQDLTPSFPESSLVILPSENDQKQKVAISPSKSDYPTTQPIVTEPYLCMETYETKDTKNRPFKVQKNEQIDVLIKDATGWWLVENEEKRLAWFPAPYLVKSSSAHMDLKEKSFTKGAFYYAQKGYEAQNSDEISVRVGVVVEVIEKSENGWWLICYNGRFGYAPAMFLKPYNNPHQNLNVLFGCERFGSTPNLLKAISSENVNKDLSLGLSTGRHENSHKAKLEKRMSRSLSNLQGFDKESGDYSTTGKRQDTFVEWHKQDSGTSRSSLQTVHPPSSSLLQESCKSHSECTIDKEESEEERKRKDSGFVEHHSPRTSVDSDYGDTPPAIPQRPSLQEIHSRCTTITKRAALQPNI
ncbi:LOW QUALITY PROTEIN: uncharacterized protein ACMZJ9_010065 [Mantella aurantiaca]